MTKAHEFTRRAPPHGGRHRRGFTLTELAIAVSITALLVGIAIPVVGASLQAADENATMERMKALAEGVKNFYEDTHQFPDTLSELVTIGDPIPGWRGPYVNEGAGATKNNIFYDAWQNPFQYIDVDADTKRLRSRGPDQADDGGGDDDINLDVDVVALAGKINRELLDEINKAILTYNTKHRITQWPYDASDDTTIPPDDPAGHWHTHKYLYEVARHECGWVYQTHRHQLTHYHNMRAFYQGKKEKDKVKEGPSWTDVPLKGPWSYTLGLLELHGLLDNSDGRYTTDAWGNDFICGPDPVQYVTSSGSYTP